MTDLNLLGSERSSNPDTRFIGTEHLYDLGMVYRGCVDDSLSVIYVDCDDDILPTVASAMSAVILSNQTPSSKMQILFNPVDIELAYIKLSLTLKSKNEEKQQSGSKKDNVEIIDNSPYDINNADKITMLVALTECSEAIINKVIAQANDGNVSIYIITNNKEVSDSFISDDVQINEDKNYSVPTKIANALENSDFSDVTKDEALSCPELFSLVTHNGKEYIALSINGKTDDSIFFEIADDNKLRMLGTLGEND